MKALLLVLALGLVMVQANSLNSESFDAALNSGKNVFVKFFAPWCGHCKRMKPDWDELMNEFGDSKSVVVAEVDCTIEEGLCGEIGVRGYPTLKYWNAGEKKDSPSDYQGGRDLESLRTFIVDNLQKLCSVADPADCNDKEVSFIDAVKGKTAEEIKAQLERLQGMADKKMKPELKRWVNQRINILKQL